MDSEEVRHVLDEDESRTQLADETGELAPQSSLRMVEASSLASGRCAAARETTGEQVNAGESNSVDGSDVVVDDGFGPSLLKDGASKRGSLDEPGVLPPREVEAVVEEAAAGEQAASGRHERWSPFTSGIKTMARMLTLGSTGLFVLAIGIAYPPRV